MPDVGPAIVGGAVNPGSQGERTRIVSIITHVSDLALAVGTGGSIDTATDPEALYDFTATPIEAARLIDTTDLTNLETWVEFVTASTPTVNPQVQFFGVDRIVVRETQAFVSQDIALLVNSVDADAIEYDIVAGTKQNIDGTNSVVAMLAAYRLDVRAFMFVLPYITVVADQACILKAKGS